MLDEAHGVNCQATNFLRSFRQIPQGEKFLESINFSSLIDATASGLGLTETPADDQSSLVRLMENFNRFILEQLHKESLSNAPINADNQPQIIDQLFGASSRSHRYFSHIIMSSPLSPFHQQVHELQTRDDSRDAEFPV
jgi:hypothetical protein